MVLRKDDELTSSVKYSRTSTNGHLKQRPLVQVDKLARWYKYRKIPKISPSKYKPPKLVTQKSPPLNRPSVYEVKQTKNGKFPSSYKLAQLTLKRKFPSVDKPLQKETPQKGPL